MKRCGHCRKMLPLDSYATNRSMVDGLQHYCRTCSKAAKQKYRQSHKGKLTEQRYDRRPSLAKYTKSEKFQIQQRRYRRSEKGKAAARLRIQRHRKTEKVKLYEQQYRKSEKRRAVQQRYDTSAKGRLGQERYRRTEKRQASMQLYRAAHKENFDKYLRAWLRTSEGKEYMVRRNYQRRAAILRTPPHQLLTLSEWRDIKLRFHNACAYCGVPESSSIKLTRDHLTPVTKGGLHTKENIVPACQPCNARKGAKLLV
jgi:5-methylcytosine-specific restriction endonuclease McrA